MMIRMIVVGLFVVNALLIGKFALQATPEEINPPEPNSSISDALPQIRLAGESMETESGLSSGQTQCFTLGPVATMSGIEQLRSALDPGALTVAVRQAEAVSRSEYWVYIPAFTTIEDVNEVARKLEDAGVDHYHVFERGAQARTVSLGLYDRRENAETRKGGIDALGLGLEVRIGLRQKTLPRYWLDYQLPPGANFAWMDDPRLPEDLQQFETPCGKLQAQTGGSRVIGSGGS
jgi:hypothetical protein